MFYYRRIFRKGRGQAFNVITLAIISILIIWTTGFLFAFIFICGTSPSNYWGSLADIAAHCVPLDVMQNAYATSDFLLDGIIIVFPMPLVRQDES